MASTVRSIRMPSSKVTASVSSPSDAADQLPAFDGLEIVEAEAMARDRDETVVGPVVRRGQHGAEAGFGRPLGGQVELEFVHTLLVVEDRALRPENLDGDAALAAPCRAADRDEARGAARQPQQDRGDVEHLDLALALRRLAGRVGLGHVAHDALDAAEQRQHQRQRMHAEIVERAIAVGRLVALLERRLGVGHEILVHLDADMVDGADRALVEQFPDVPDHRILDVVVAEHGGLAGARAPPQASFRRRPGSAPSASRTRHACRRRVRRVAISRWNLFGVVIETTSTSGSATTLRQSPEDFSKPNSAALARARSSFASPRWTRRTSGTSPNTGLTAFQASAWLLPMKPLPISPTPIMLHVSSLPKICGGGTQNVVPFRNAGTKQNK